MSLVPAESVGAAARYDYLTRRDLAELMRMSVPTVDRLNAGGKLPRPVRVGQRLLWERETMTRWLAAGAPDRRTWELMEASRRKFA